MPFHAFIEIVWKWKILAKIEKELNFVSFFNKNLLMHLFYETRPRQSEIQIILHWLRSRLPVLCTSEGPHQQLHLHISAPFFRPLLKIRQESKHNLGIHFDFFNKVQTLSSIKLVPTPKSRNICKANFRWSLQHSPSIVITPPLPPKIKIT